LKAGAKGRNVRFLSGAKRAISPTAHRDDDAHFDVMLCLCYGLSADSAEILASKKVVSLISQSE
jgi:hypothetical protein